MPYKSKPGTRKYGDNPLKMEEYTPFKMKGHTLPGINQRSETENLPDGRSASSPFQAACPNPIVGPGGKKTKCPTKGFKVRGRGKKKIKKRISKIKEGVRDIFRTKPSKKKEREEKRIARTRKRDKTTYADPRYLEPGPPTEHPTTTARKRKKLTETPGTKEYEIQRKANVKRKKDLESLEKGVVPKDMYSGKRDKIKSN